MMTPSDVSVPSQVPSLDLDTRLHWDMCEPFCPFGLAEPPPFQLAEFDMPLICGSDPFSAQENFVDLLLSDVKKLNSDIFVDNMRVKDNNRVEDIPSTQIMDLDSTAVAHKNLSSDDQGNAIKVLSSPETTSNAIDENHELVEDLFQKQIMLLIDSNPTATHLQELAADDLDFNIIKLPKKIKKSPRIPSAHRTVFHCEWVEPTRPWVSGELLQCGQVRMTSLRYHWRRPSDALLRFPFYAKSSTTESTPVSYSTTTTLKGGYRSSSFSTCRERLRMPASVLKAAGKFTSQRGQAYRSGATVWLTRNDQLMKFEKNKHAAAFLKLSQSKFSALKLQRGQYQGWKIHTKNPNNHANRQPSVHARTVWLTHIADGRVLKFDKNKLAAYFLGIPSNKLAHIKSRSKSKVAIYDGWSISDSDPTKKYNG